MTVDISFGKAIQREDGDERYDWCDWPGEPHEADGTSPEFTIFSGKPRRSFSNSGFGDWTRRIKPAAAIAAVCWKDEQQITPLTPDVLALIDQLPDNRGSDGDRDRARWFKYWARRAVETFGDAAVIHFY